MSEEYYTIARAARTENVVKKSKFICYVNPVETSEEARALLETVRKEHWRANHNVWAWRIGHQVPGERFSDDGEPAGTAGIPVLEVLCVSVSYPLLGSVLNVLEEAGARLEEPDFGVEVAVKGWVLPSKRLAVEKRILELGCGLLSIQWNGEKFFLSEDT